MDNFDLALERERYKSELPCLASSCHYDFRKSLSHGKAEFYSGIVKLTKETDTEKKLCKRKTRQDKTGSTVKAANVEAPAARSALCAPGCDFGTQPPACPPVGMLAPPSGCGSLCPTLSRSLRPGHAACLQARAIILQEADECNKPMLA